MIMNPLAMMYDNNTIIWHFIAIKKQQNKTKHTYHIKTKIFPASRMMDGLILHKSYLNWKHNHKQQYIYNEHKH